MNTKSLLRRLEYKALSAISIDGDILDVGGSTKSGYQELLRGTHTIVTANIDASYGADIVFDAEEVWPIEDNVYDAVLCINLLEHTYKYQTVLSEAHRVLKPGGRVVSVTPFMFNVHGSPSDYFRYTRSALERMFVEAGFSKVEIREMGTGAFSVIYHVLIGFVPRWCAGAVIALCTGIDSMLARIRPGKSMSERSMPLGYMVDARR